MQENPFTPSFGEVPLHLAGRDDVIRALSRAYESECRRPELTLAITGARGTGKTALLSVAANEAQARGWIAVNVMAMGGMLDDILIQAKRAAKHLVKTGSGAPISGFGIGEVLHVDLDNGNAAEENWRSKMEDLLDELDKLGVGLLITVDEVQPSLDELVQLAANYQLFVRENRKVGLILAGLPHNMSALLQDKSVSFLRRAQSCHLGRLTDLDVELALKRSIEESGRHIEPDALGIAVRAAQGFPFMMQLVGYQLWEANAAQGTITPENAREGISVAEREMTERVIAATYQGLSDGDRRFLAAMVQDDGDSLIGEIASRLGKTTQYATQYKRRLMEQGVIGERGRGKLGFDLPYMRDFVKSRQDE